MKFLKKDTVTFILYKRKEFSEVIKYANDYNYDLKFLFAVNINGDEYDLLPITETKFNYKNIHYLKYVIAPYIDPKTKKPRGWFKNGDGSPVRFSSLGNSFYVNTFEELEYVLSKAFNQNIPDELEEKYKNIYPSESQVKDAEEYHKNKKTLRGFAALREQNKLNK